MQQLEQLIKELQEMDITEMVSDALLVLEKKFIALQREQLGKGKTSEGDKIGDYTSPPYKRKRQRRGLQTEYVDLCFFGGYYQSLKLEKRGKYIWIYSTWEGQKWLVARYGIDIYDLNSSSRAKLVDDVAEIVSEKMIQKLTS